MSLQKKICFNANTRYDEETFLQNMQAFFSIAVGCCSRCSVLGGLYAMERRLADYTHTAVRDAGSVAERQRVPTQRRQGRRYVLREGRRACQVG